MSDSVETRLARLEAKFEFVLDSIKEDRMSRKAQYESIEALNQSVVLIGKEVKDLKDSMAGQAPTIQEFIEIKHKVVGAGKFGKYMWIGFGAVMTFLWSSREAIIHLITGVK